MEGSFLSFTVPILLWLIAVRLWSWFIGQTADSQNKLPLPPGAVGLPFIGETLQLAWKGYSFFRERRDSYGRVYKTHLMGRPTVRVFGSDNIKKVLRSEEVNVCMQWPTSVKMLIGERSLMVSSGEIHHIRRSCLLTAFTQQAVNGYLPAMQNAVRQHLDKWVTQGTILGQKQSRYLATDVTARCILGYDYCQRDIYLLTEAMDIIEKGFFSLPYNIPGSPLSKGMASRELVMELIDKAIDAAQVRLDTEPQGTEPQGTASQDALTILLSQSSKSKDRLTHDELRDTCMEMLFSSVEGISSAICTMLLELARHGHATERASQELFHHDLMETQRDGDLTVAKMTDLNYIHRLVKEVLRLTPPMGGGYRHVLRTMEIDGYQIPKGWTILYSIRDQHETGSDNSKQFDPDRWMPNRDITKVDDYLYIPFGGNGIRSCVGERFAVMCLEVMAAEVIRSCQWRLMDANPAMKYFPVPYPSDGLPLSISQAPPFRQRRVTL